MLLIVTHSLATLEVSFVSRKFFIMQAIELLDQRDDTFKKRVYVLSIFLSFEPTKVVPINWSNSATQFGHLNVTLNFRYNFGPTVIIIVIIMSLFKLHPLAENIFQQKRSSLFSVPGPCPYRRAGPLWPREDSGWQCLKTFCVRNLRMFVIS
jgi:hypothetical protein